MEEYKQCGGKCKGVKLTSEFNQDKSKKDGLQNQCKECQKEKNRQFRKNNPKYMTDWNKSHPTYMGQYTQDKKDGKHYVYFLPEVNYVGVTDNIYYRMSEHKSDNNITNKNNYQIIGKFDNRDTAERFEKYKHSLGYLDGGTNLLNYERRN